MTIALCLLTWNELRGCQMDVPLLPEGLFSEIYAIDGGSTDGTQDFLKANEIRVVQQSRKSYNGAYLDAMEASTADAVVLFHPKGTIDPLSLREMHQYLSEGVELVVASRMIRGAENEEDAKFFRPRKWFVLALAASAILIWHKEGAKIRDVLHGYRGVNKQFFVDMKPLEYGTSIDYEMVIRSYRLKRSRLEFPIKELPRPYGATHFKAFATGKILLRYLAYEIRRSI